MSNVIPKDIPNRSDLSAEESAVNDFFHLQVGDQPTQYGGWLITRADTLEEAQQKAAEEAAAQVKKDSEAAINAAAEKAYLEAQKKAAEDAAKPSAAESANPFVGVPASAIETATEGGLSDKTLLIYGASLLLLWFFLRR
jgi:regulator of protease activity HflC (stomatin/prohibitin superfamily)